MKLKALNCNKQYLRDRRRRGARNRLESRLTLEPIATGKATTMAVTEQQIQDALKSLIDPNTRKDYATTKSARNIKVDGDKVSVEILLGYPAKSQLAPIREQVAKALKALPGVGGVNVNVQMKIVSHAVQCVV